MSTQISRSDADVYGLAGPAVPTSPVPVEDVPIRETAPQPAAEAPADEAPAKTDAKADAGADAKADAKAKAKARTKGKRPRRGAPVWKWDAPSWGVSLMVHVAVLVALALMAVGSQLEQVLGSIDAGTVEASKADDDLTALYAEPTDAERDLAVADPTSILAPGATSSTPPIRSAMAEVSETKSLQGLVAFAAPKPSLSMIPSSSNLDLDLSGGKQLSGETGRPVDGYGEALDQLAREILSHLAKRQVTVLWMFDESGSMKDDQRTIRDRFDRVINELRVQVPSDRRQAGDLQHAIIGFGEKIHFEKSPPRSDLEDIRKAIDSLRVDESGVENTMQAIVRTLEHYNTRLVPADRKILLVLITDESGDDGDLVEQARLSLVNRGATAYVLGRQSMFGYDKVRLRWVDPVTGDEYWPTIDRGPETAAPELLQWDGLWKTRYDEQPSGFAPYELARLVKDTGGIFFLLPNEEELRVRPSGEKAYPHDLIKEYTPDYRARNDYHSSLSQSQLRLTLGEIIQVTRNDFGFERHFPVNPPELAQKIAQEVPRVEIQLRALIEMEKRLRRMEVERDKEPTRRWKANYDLMLAQVVAFQVKAYEYRACLAEMVSLANQGKLIPQKPPIPNQRRTDWVINHSGKKKAPSEETEKKYAEATRLLQQVIANHPDTPWADLAQTTLDRGLGCDWTEWHAHPDYEKRRANVPKY